MRTIELLRKYVMSDNPVNIQVLSDQESNFSLCVRRGSGAQPLCCRSRCSFRALQQQARQL